MFVTPPSRSASRCSPGSFHASVKRHSSPPSAGSPWLNFSLKDSIDGPTPTKVTTLDNGLKVASSDLPTPAATIGLYIESGSAFDEIPGTAHLIQHMAFKSSSSVSQLKMVTVCEALGAAVSSLSSRENTVYQIDTLKSSVPELVGLLAQREPTAEEGRAMHELHGQLVRYAKMRKTLNDALAKVK